MRMKTLVISALMAASLANAGTASGGSRPPPISKDISDPKLEHMAIWTEDLEKTSKFLTDVVGWRRHPVEFGVDEDSTVFGGMKLAFVDANGLWLELIEPTTPGPGMDLLKEKGKGAIVELDFGGVKDFDRTVEELKLRGVEAVGMDGKPLAGGGLLREWVMVDGKRVRGDERLAYLPLDKSGGTGIELFWEYPNGVVLLRDKQWAEEAKKPQTGPRLDHVVVLSSDLRKTTPVYTDILNLKRSPVTDGVPREWMKLGDETHAWIDGGGAGSIWIDVVAPAKAVSASPLFTDKRLGEGAIVEIAVEVPDIAAYYDKMQAKGVTMTAGDATPLPAGQKFVTVAGTGDRFNYFPLDKSEGMRILVFQRGDGPKSVFARRGALPAH